MLKALDYNEIQEAIRSAKTLYVLHLIDLYAYQVILNEINDRTGE